MSVMNARRRLPSRRLIRTTAAATALGLGALTLAACGNDSAAGDDGKVNVVASFYPMKFLAQEIGGKYVSVDSLTKPGVEPHDLELSPQQTGQLSEADLVVYLKGLQPAVDEAVGQSGVKNVAEATSYTSLESHGDDVHGEEGHDHGGEEGHEGHEEHEGHSHETESGEDPHIWLDPVRYAEVAKGVGKELAKADPDHKATYEKNTASLVKRLESLNEEFEKGLEKRKTDTFVTTHAAFGYFAERYGLHEEAVSGIDPESEPSAARMKELHTVAKEDKVSTVFFEDNASDKTAKALAGDLKLKTGVLSPLESVKNEKKQDYFSVMRENLSALRTALNAGSGS
ncbi:metal ABC transporter substrate-binding protein [Streptomyces daliensis]|uniref:Zinc ABC transporter substrate-binding protein n=1 Tax=Streptomyces daliensis TaxID=299421 RepID=A0A8T4J0E0_9ACTN|nr:zinc ABC transporter substrate-binding protein [Streptomyces daliensis]